MRIRIQIVAFTAVLLAWPASVFAQSIVTLDECIERAYEHYAFNKQQEVTTLQTQRNVDRIEKSYLPSLDLNAIATYQNEQISIPIGINVPGFEPPVAPLNINTALLTLRQWIYDGSMMHYNRLTEEAQGKVALQQIEVQRLEIKTTVMQQYFAVLLSDKHMSILREKREVLAKRLGEVDLAVEAHVLLKSDADLLRAEKVKLDQAITEAEFTRAEHVKALARLTNTLMSKADSFEPPAVELTEVQNADDRPDIKLIDNQQELLEASKGRISSVYLPKIGLFADVGMGLPGYDIFSDAVSPMAKVGLTVSWKIFDWGQGGIQEESIDLSKQLLTMKQDRIRTQVSVQTDAQLTSIEKSTSLITSDQTLVELYKSISKAYASQLENGTITSAAYIEQLNKQEEAQTNLELHQLQLLIATMNYNTLLGQ